MKRRIFNIILTVIFILPIFANISSYADSTYKISYDKGLHNSYQGQEPDNFIKGNPPDSVYVKAGGSFTVAENTFTFRDYYFAGWSYTYKDSSGSSKAKLFKPGQTVSDVNSNMVLKAVWAQSPKELVISGFIYYCDINSTVVTSVDNTHFVGETISLKAPESKPDASFSFAGWLDSESGTVYKPNDLFEIKKFSTTLSAVWEKDGQPINFCNVNVSCTKGGKASIEKQSVISGQEITVEFFPDEGYKIKRITLNGKDVGSKKTLSFKVTESENNINAEFVLTSATPNPTTTSPSESKTEPSDNKKVSLIISKETSGESDGKIYINGVEFIAFNSLIEYEKGEIINISYELSDGSEVESILVKENTIGVDNYLSKGNPFSITMNNSTNITFNFKEVNAKDKSLKGDKMLVMMLFLIALSIAFAALFVMLRKNNKKSKKRKKRKTNYNNRRR